MSEATRDPKAKKVTAASVSILNGIIALIISATGWEPSVNAMAVIITLSSSINMALGSWVGDLQFKIDQGKKTVSEGTALLLRIFAKLLG